MQQQETKKPRRIRQVSVTNLFGIFNHTIPLKMDERITIIHGPNGFGKTMMLKLLSALFSTVDQLAESDQLLENIPFDEFRVDFEDNTSFWVSKTSRSRNLPEKTHPSKREIVFHATNQEPHPLRPKTSQNRTPKWLVDMRESVPIHLIETQRLFSSTKISQYNKCEKIVASEDAIKEHARKIGISDNLARRKDLFTTIINDRFFYKTMTTDKEKGLVFTTENGISLLPLTVSSLRFK
jgi:AAA15 family ATPase/GTPase